MKRDREPGSEHTGHNIDLDAVVGLTSIGTKGGEGGSTKKIIVEPSTLYERTPGAGEKMVANVVRGMEDAARKAGKKVEIVVRRSGRTYGFSKRDPRSRYLCPELFPEIPAADPLSMD